MKRSVLQTYKKEILIFYICAAVSLTVASFADLKLDIFLNHPSDFIANWFEKTGEAPSYLLLPAAMAFIMKCAEPKWLKITAGIGCAAGGGYFGYWFGGNVFADNGFRELFSVVFGVGVGLVMLFCMRFITIPENARKPILFIAFIGLLAGALGNVLTEGMKTVWGRVRFKSMEAPYTDFTPWFRLNGDNGNHSFPSGHTAGAGVSYQLMLLPLVSKKCRERKTILFLIAFVFTSVVACTRLVMGAHFLSDVTVGGTISFTCTLLGIAVYEKFAGRFGIK